MFLDKVGVGNLIETFRNSETAAKTNQILLWVMLMQFERSLKNKTSKVLLDDNGLFKAVLGLLDGNAAIVKGRVYLFIYFVLAFNLKKSLALL